MCPHFDRLEMMAVGLFTNCVIFSELQIVENIAYKILISSSLWYHINTFPFGKQVWYVRLNTRFKERKASVNYVCLCQMLKDVTNVYIITSFSENSMCLKCTLSSDATKSTKLALALP